MYYRISSCFNVVWKERKTRILLFVTGCDYNRVQTIINKLIQVLSISYNFTNYIQSLVFEKPEFHMMAWNTIIKAYENILSRNENKKTMMRAKKWQTNKKNKKLTSMQKPSRNAIWRWIMLTCMYHYNIEIFENIELNILLLSLDTRLKWIELNATYKKMYAL